MRRRAMAQEMGRQKCKKVSGVRGKEMSIKTLVG